MKISLKVNGFALIGLIAIAFIFSIKTMFIALAAMILIPLIIQIALSILILIVELFQTMVS